MNYYDVQALSSSTIKFLLRMKEDDKEKWYRAFGVGSVTVYILTEDMSKFDDIFEIIQGVTVPTGNADKFKNALINQDVDWQNPVFDYEAAFIESGIKRPKTYEEFIKNYDYSWLDFYKLKKKKEAEGKIVILQEDLDLGKSLVEKVKNSKCAKYFFSQDKDFEVHGQVEIYGVIDDCWCKIKIDSLIIDHKNKQILIVDAKTTNEYSSNFELAMENFSYQIQAEWYVKVLREAQNKSCNVEGLLDKLVYEVNEEFIFVVIPKNDSSVIDCFYKTGQKHHLDKIELAMNMWKTCLKAGRHPNKQNYVETLDKWYVN